MISSISPLIAPRGGDLLQDNRASGVGFKRSLDGGHLAGNAPDPGDELVLVGLNVAHTIPL